MRQPELSHEAQLAVAETVREMASPTRTSWEAIAALVCCLTFIFTRPPSESNGIPFLLDHSTAHFIGDFVLLAFSAGFGFSAARNEECHGRLTGAVIFAFSIIVICDWMHLLLNWRERWWG